MRLNEGKIGKQESVSLIAIAMVAATFSLAAKPVTIA